MDNYAFMIIDMQKDCLRLHHPQNIRRMVAAQKAVISECNRLRLPIIFVEYQGKGKTARVLTDVARQNPNVLTHEKEWVDAFDRSSEPRLEDTLKHLGINHILIAGIHGHACVYEGVSSAYRLGFRFSTAEDLIGYEPGTTVTSNEIAKRNMKRLAANYVQTHKELIPLFTR